MVWLYVVVGEVRSKTLLWGFDWHDGNTMNRFGCGTLNPAVGGAAAALVAGGAVSRSYCDGGHGTAHRRGLKTSLCSGRSVLLNPAWIFHQPRCPGNCNPNTMFLMISGIPQRADLHFKTKLKELRQALSKNAPKLEQHRTAGQQ